MDHFRHRIGNNPSTKRSRHRGRDPERASHQAEWGKRDSNGGATHDLFLRGLGAESVGDLDATMFTGLARSWEPVGQQERPDWADIPPTREEVEALGLDASLAFFGARAR